MTGQGADRKLTLLCYTSETYTRGRDYDDFVWFSVKKEKKKSKGSLKTDLHYDYNADYIIKYERFIISDVAKICLHQCC